MQHRLKCTASILSIQLIWPESLDLGPKFDLRVADAVFYEVEVALSLCVIWDKSQLQHT
jgi:hypothetical protein